MFSSDAPFVAYVLKYKNLTNCTKIVQYKPYFLQYCRFATKYTALHQNEEKLGKYMINLKIYKMLSNWSGLVLVVPFPRTLTPPYLSLSSLSMAGMNPAHVSWLGKCGWNPPSEAKVAEASVFKILPFLLYTVLSVKKCAGNFNFNNTWNGVAETGVEPICLLLWT